MVTGGTNPEMKARIKKGRKGLLNFCKKGANSPATPKLSLQHSYKLKYFLICTGFPWLMILNK